jgi:hypothetical protein
MIFGKDRDKRTGPLSDLIKGKRNQFPQFEAKAKKLVVSNAPRVFVIMPIQGEEHGTQEDQRVYREYDERFVAIETVIAKAGCVAIRIDKEHPLEDLVGRIKTEIKNSIFLAGLKMARYRGMRARWRQASPCGPQVDRVEDRHRSAR